MLHQSHMQLYTVRTLVRLKHTIRSDRRTELEYYTPLKEALFCSLKVHTLKKFATALRAVKLYTVQFLSSASRHTAWPLQFKFSSYAYDFVRLLFEGGNNLWVASITLQGCSKQAKARLTLPLFVSILRHAHQSGHLIRKVPRMI